MVLALLVHGCFLNYAHKNFFWSNVNLRPEQVNHPVLITESVCNPVQSRCKMAELLFETYGVPSVGMDSEFPLYETLFTLLTIRINVIWQMHGPVSICPELTGNGMWLFLNWVWSSHLHLFHDIFFFQISFIWHVICFFIYTFCLNLIGLFSLSQHLVLMLLSAICIINNRGFVIKMVLLSAQDSRRLMLYRYCQHVMFHVVSHFPSFISKKQKHTVSTNVCKIDKNQN